MLEIVFPSLLLNFQFVFGKYNLILLFFATDENKREKRRRKLLIYGAPFCAVWVPFLIPSTLIFLFGGRIKTNKLFENHFYNWFVGSSSIYTVDSSVYFLFCHFMAFESIEMLGV